MTTATTETQAIAATDQTALRWTQVSRDRKVACVPGGEIHVRRGTFSRTGRAMGNVDEGRCVQIEARRDNGRISSERLYALDRHDPTARNRIGTLGAYCPQEPAESAIDAAVARAQEVIAGTREPPFGLDIRCVPAAEMEK
jgi:hypothetical protein